MMPRPPHTLFPYTTLFRSTTPLGPGTVVYRDASWATLGARHVSHANTTSGVPAEQQYACGGGASRVNRPRANEVIRSEEHTSELQSHSEIVCRLLLEKKKL